MVIDGKLGELTFEYFFLKHNFRKNLSNVKYFLVSIYVIAFTNGKQNITSELCTSKQNHFLAGK